MVSGSTGAHRGPGRFCHEAFFYSDEDDCVGAMSAFVEEGLRVGEPALVALSAQRIALLQERLSGPDEAVSYVDMAVAGRNPASIIPLWVDFVNAHSGRPSRGIGEPIWAERTPAELAECQRHEALLNVAFTGGGGLRLMCPYDTTALGDDIVAEARRTHPFVRHGHDGTVNPEFVGVEALAAPFTEPLPDPPRHTPAMAFDSSGLSDVRRAVRAAAAAAGLAPSRVADAVLAVNEVATNSLRHGGGGGHLRVWSADMAFVCEVSDSGSISEPMVGRRRPTIGAGGGRGLWIVNQLCDLAQVRSTPTGTTVRMHLGPSAPGGT
ncbi:MAG: anti-sigma factor RsbA family regulatory protein [Acidimicrobiales bacterium]